MRLLVPARHRELVLGDLEEEFASAMRWSGSRYLAPGEARQRLYRLVWHNVMHNCGGPAGVWALHSRLLKEE